MSEKEETTPPTVANKVAIQLGKLRDANIKYKNLLKMAKERIEQQENELKKLRGRWLELGVGYNMTTLSSVVFSLISHRGPFLTALAHQNPSRERPV